MEFTLADVEQALAVQNSDIAGLQAANEIINKWLESENILGEMTEILSRNDDRYVRFKIASGMKIKIEFLWGSTPDELKAAIRQELVNQIQKMTDIEDNLRAISKCIGIIASLDMPDEWENFFEFCFAAEGHTPQQVMACLCILNAYAEEIDNSTIISRRHKIAERNQLIDNGQLFFNTCMMGFQDPVTNPLALKCLNYLLKWSQIADFVTDELINKLLNQDLINSASQKAALECLTTIFVERSDNFMYFRRLSPFVAIALNTHKDPTNPNLPITNSEDVMNFLIKFMFPFLDIIRVLNLPEETTKNKVLMAELSNMAEEPLASIAEAGIDLPTFNEMIVNLIHVILSIPMATTEFWSLWQSIFRDMQHESFLNTVMSLHGVFEPLMPVIRDSIYRLLETAADETDGSCISVARICFSALIDLNQEEAAQFLNEQEPSVSLCFALSSAALCYNTETIMENISEQVSKILESISEESSQEFICAAVFACSHVNAFIESDPNIFMTVIRFLLENISSGTGKVISACALALVNIIKEAINFLSSNCSTLVGEVIHSSEEFLNNLDPTNMKLVFLCCTMLAKTIDDETQFNETLDTLFGPVVGALSEFYGDPGSNAEKAVLACDIIQTCTGQMYGRSEHFEELFIEPLMSIAPNIFNVIEFAEVSDYLLSALAQILTIMGTEPCMAIFNQVLEMLLGTREATDTVFNFIAVVKSTHEEIDKQFPLIFERFVQPALELDPPPLEQILIMVSKFSIEVVPLDFLVELVKQGIASLDTNTNIAAINGWFEITSYIPAGIDQEIMIARVSTIIPVVFEAIVSMLHSPCYDDLARLMMREIKALCSTDKVEEAIEQLNQTFNEISPEPQEGLYKQFLSYCFSPSTPKFKITGAIANLLVTLRKSSPVDADAFKIQKRKSTFFSTLMPFMLNDLFIVDEPHVITLTTSDNNPFLPTKFQIKKPNAPKIEEEKKEDE
jgi:hypothetical protein